MRVSPPTSFGMSHRSLARKLPVRQPSSISIVHVLVSRHNPKRTRSGAYLRNLLARDLASCSVRWVFCAELVRNRPYEPTLPPHLETDRGLRKVGSSSPIVAVMQPAHALLANHLTIVQRTHPASRCLFFQPEVRSVFVIVR